ncbi:oxidoreductase [Nocardia takedensis]
MVSGQAIRQDWTEASVPDCTGRVAVVTGANSGIGFQTARILAARGARVVLMCRDLDKGAAAVARIRQDTPDAELSSVALDLLSLSAIREAADRVRAEHPRIDLLFNNAGTTFTQRTTSADGFEATLATNHLGPFAFTGLLLDRLASVPDSRIVTVSSLTYKLGPIDLDDLQSERGRYRNMRVYGRSKLANLLFTFELQRRLAAAGAPTVATAAHPGSAHTSFGDHMGPLSRRLNSGALRPLAAWTQQPADRAALPSLRAALDPEVSGGDFFGPSGWGEFKGYPVLSEIAPNMIDPQAQEQLWLESERLTGVVYDFESAVHGLATEEPSHLPLSTPAG